MAPPEASGLLGRWLWVAGAGARSPWERQVGMCGAVNTEARGRTVSQLGHVAGGARDAWRRRLMRKRRRAPSRAPAVMKVIQVGIGGMGNAWLNAVNRSEVVQFAGFVEINEEISAAQVAAYDLDPATIYKSLPEALDALGSVDGVINVTPPQFHKAVTLTALDAGIPVLTEKPLAGTLDDAQAISKAARGAGGPGIAKIFGKG